MELRFPILVLKSIINHHLWCGSSIETEVRVWYVWSGGEVEWMGSTAVWYLIQQVMTIPYTLEYMQQALVSGTRTLLQLFNYTGSRTAVLVLGIINEVIIIEWTLEATPTFWPRIGMCLDNFCTQIDSSIVQVGSGSHVHWHAKYKLSHKKGFLNEFSACRDGTLKNQPN